MKQYILVVGAGTGWYSGFFTRTDAEKVLMVAVFSFVILDWITGIAAAYREGEPILSSRMRQGGTKIIGYFGLVLMSVVTAEVLKATDVPIPEMPVLSAALGFILAAEALSLLENIHKLTGLKLQWLARIVEGIGPSTDEQPKQQKNPKK